MDQLTLTLVVLASILVITLMAFLYYYLQKRNRMNQRTTAENKSTPSLNETARSNQALNKVQEKKDQVIPPKPVFPQSTLKKEKSVKNMDIKSLPRYEAPAKVDNGLGKKQTTSSSNIIVEPRMLETHQNIIPDMNSSPNQSPLRHEHTFGYSTENRADDEGSAPEMPIVTDQLRTVARDSAIDGEKVPSTNLMKRQLSKDALKMMDEDPGKSPSANANAATNKNGQIKPSTSAADILSQVKKDIAGLKKV
jgi:hypothetical protein